MIVKKIPGPKVGGRAVSRATHARHLVDYMRLPDKEGAFKEYLIAYAVKEKLGDLTAERLFHMGARNFICDDIDGQRAEMMAVAQAAVRSPNPIDHWLISWREGEFPTTSQVDEAVDMFVEHLGLAANQCFYAVHGDTHNRHAHIAINRYNPAIGRVVEINDGFNREAAHQAVALIVDHFGWQPEAKARYGVKDGKPVMAQLAADRISGGDRPIKPAAAIYEVRTGYRSAQRIAQEEALPIIRGARSWAALHAALAARGMTYEAVGTNGAIIAVDGERVKSSNVHRSIVLGRLERTFGPFEARDAAIKVVGRETDSDAFPGAFRADEYRQQRVAWDLHRAAIKAKRDRDRALSSDAKPKKSAGPILSMLAGQLAGRAVKKAEDPIKPQRPAPDLESFYYQNHEFDLAELWRLRDGARSAQELTFAAVGGTMRDEIDGYRAHSCLGGTRYARDGEGTAFIDRGSRVALVSGTDEALLAGLKLAAIKSGGKVTVNGTKKFKRQVEKVASANGLGHVLLDLGSSATDPRGHPISRAKGPRAPEAPFIDPRTRGGAGR